MHFPIYVVDTTEIGDNEDSDKVEFIDKYEKRTLRKQISKVIADPSLYNNVQKEKECKL